MISVHTQTIKNLVIGFKKQWRLFMTTFIAILAILSASVFWYTTHQKNNITYTSTAKILLKPASSAKMDGGTTQLYLNTEKSIISANSYLDYLKKQIKSELNLNAKDLVDYQVEADNGTSIVAVHVTSKTATKANKLSKFIGNNIVQNPMDILQNGSAQVIQVSQAKADTAGFGGKVFYLFSFIVAFIFSLLITLIKVYYDPKIYDVAILKDVFPTSKIYNPADETQLEDTFGKIIKNNSSDKTISVLYFSEYESVLQAVKNILMKSDDDKKIVNYSNRELSHSEGGVQQLPVSDLYNDTNEKNESVQLIDCSEIINSGVGNEQALVVKAGVITKSQVASLVNEFKGNVVSLAIIFLK